MKLITFIGIITSALFVWYTFKLGVLIYCTTNKHQKALIQLEELVHGKQYIFPIKRTFACCLILLIISLLCFEVLTF